MPNSTKKPAKSGTKSLLPKAALTSKPRFDPKQSRMPCGLQNRTNAGGKPKLFPGRTGGR